MKPKNAAVWLTILSGAVACFYILPKAFKNSNSVPLSTVRSFSISNEQEQSLILKSNSSQTGNEAYKLYRYYLFSRGNAKEAVKWLRLAVDQGHPNAADELKEFGDHGEQ